MRAARQGARAGGGAADRSTGPQWGDAARARRRGAVAWHTTWSRLTTTALWESSSTYVSGRMEEGGGVPFQRSCNQGLAVDLPGEVNVPAQTGGPPVCTCAKHHANTHHHLAGKASPSP